MKERPILFSGPMVRAILEGRKTQTLRVVKPLPKLFDGVWQFVPKLRDGIGSAWRDGIDPYVPSSFLADACPYGRPGDRLWVRETWCCAHSTEDKPSPNDLVHYRADKSEAGDVITKVSSWSPSIHMPRAYSRITLEITGVRVERLQSITDADAIADVVDRTNTSIAGYAVEHYKSLWESINGAGSWFANPWVWMVEFKPLDIKK